MNQNVQYSHARNSHPAPPITIMVEQGAVVKLKIDKKAIRTYTGREISELFEAAGVGPCRILRPIPERLVNVSLSALRISLVPGEYEVEHLRDCLFMPESAYSYSVHD